MKGSDRMKVAITAMGKEMTDKVDPRFGRAKYFVITDTESDATEVHDNKQNLDAVQGAGVQAGETVAGLGVNAVVTGHVGPKAFRTLAAGGIKIYLCGEMTVADAVQKLKAGELKESQSPDSESHWV